MARRVFSHLAVPLPIAVGESLFAAARGAGLPIPTACVGQGTCGLCRVKVIAGEALLSPPNAVERRHLGNTYFVSKLRLACQTLLIGDGAVEVALPDAPRRR